jgi:hypothetical protein
VPEVRSRRSYEHFAASKMPHGLALEVRSWELRSSVIGRFRLVSEEKLPTHFSRHKFDERHGKQMSYAI